MHPDLLNNSVFLKYYRQWQENPTSVVFAPIAEFFLRYGMINEAEKVCADGLQKHPDFVSGQIVMAKVQIKRGELENAKSVLTSVLEKTPSNESARKLMMEISPSWVATLTNNTAEATSTSSSTFVQTPTSTSISNPTSTSTSFATGLNVQNVSTLNPHSTSISSLSGPNEEETTDDDDKTLEEETTVRKFMPEDLGSEDEDYSEVTTPIYAQFAGETRPRSYSPSWETVTMANIYLAQGHTERAREIFESIIRRDPSNEQARRGLDELASRGG